MCPPELDQTRPLKPPVPDGATLTANAVGGAWLAALVAWGESVAKLFDDAKAGCPPATAATP